MSRPTGLGEYRTEELEAELAARKQADQYKCPSYYDDEGALQDCRCGKCGEPHNTPLNADDTQEPRDLIQICTDIYYECETIKRLDELTDEALDWHNKQILEMLKDEQDDNERSVSAFKYMWRNKLKEAGDVRKD